VWLSADSQFGEYAAVSAWLNQYHNPVFLSQSVILHTKMYGANHINDGNSEKTEVTAFKRAGTMAAALIFKVGETRRYGDRDSVMMYAEASNGQMPNLDLLNVVHYLAVHRQGFRVNMAAFSSLLSSAWLRVIAEFLHTLGSVLRKINPDWKLDIAVPDYVEGTANLANSIYSQVTEINISHFTVMALSFMTLQSLLLGFVRYRLLECPQGPMALSVIIKLTRFL
jgi:glycosylphosphatidylinositol transamidase